LEQLAVAPFSSSAFVIKKYLIKNKQESLEAFDYGGKY
jgi:hypothetical protein